MKLGKGVSSCIGCEEWTAQVVQWQAANKNHFFKKSHFILCNRYSRLCAWRHTTVMFSYIYCCTKIKNESSFWWSLVGLTHLSMNNMTSPIWSPQSSTLQMPCKHHRPNFVRVSPMQHISSWVLKVISDGSHSSICKHQQLVFKYLISKMYFFSPVTFHLGTLKHVSSFDNG